MTGEQQRAAAWAVRLLDSLLALTGCDIKPESREKFQTLRDMAGGRHG